MATENKFGSAQKDPAVFPTVVGEGATYLNTLMRTVSTVVVTAAIEVASTYNMLKIHSSSIIDPDSKIHFDAMGTAVTMDIGSLASPDALTSDVDVATAGNAPLIEVFPIEDFGKRLWELLGLSEDPNEDIDIIVTTAGATASAGDKDLVLDVRTGQQ